MSRYVYQIQGALESATGEFKGFRVLVCNVNHLGTVDVPVEVLDRETAKYIQFRLRATQAVLDISKLPVEIQNRIRAPLGRWLDQWVRQNFYGHISNSKSLNS